MASMAVGRRADPDEPGPDDGPGEVRRLGQEPVAGVDGVGPAATGGVEEQVDAEIGVGRRGPGQPHGQVGLGTCGLSASASE